MASALFIRGLLAILAQLWPQSPIMKQGQFSWGPKQDESFVLIKERLTTAPVLALPDFDKSL